MPALKSFFRPRLEVLEDRLAPALYAFTEGFDPKADEPQKVKAEGFASNFLDPNVTSNSSTGSYGQKSLSILGTPLDMVYAEAFVQTFPSHPYSPIPLKPIGRIATGGFARADSFGVRSGNISGISKFGTRSSASGEVGEPVFFYAPTSDTTIHFAASSFAEGNTVAISQKEVNLIVNGTPHNVEVGNGRDSAENFIKSKFQVKAGDNVMIDILGSASFQAVPGAGNEFVPNWGVQIYYQFETRPDVETVKYVWRRNSDEGGGVDLTYKVANWYTETPPPILLSAAAASYSLPPPTIGLYWSETQTYSPQTAFPAYKTQGQTTTGEHKLHVKATEFTGLPNNKTKYLLFVVDPDKQFEEADEQNNEKALAADERAIFSPVEVEGAGEPVRSVKVNLTRSIIDAYLRPAGGALTLSQAKAIAGVHHFNWEQYVIAQPSYWRVYRNSTGSTIPVPRLDPQPFLIVIAGYNGNEAVVLHVGDGNGLYWDEVGGEWLSYINNDFQFQFHDQPLYSRNLFDPSALGLLDAVTFHTSLVGVREDGSKKVYDRLGWGTSFTWKTNSRVNEQIAYEKAIPDSELPPVVAGGIFEAAYDGLPANHKPVLSPLKDESATNGKPILVTAVVNDSDTGQTLTFNLTPDAPVGAKIDPKTGVFSWTPSESQSPGIYTITIQVRDNGDPPLADSKSFKITVGSGKTTPTINVTGGTFTYDGKPHAATGSIIGINGINLGTPTFTYNGSSTVPTNAGTYAVVASFAGNANYNPVSKSTTLVINKAQPSLSSLSSPTIIYRTGTTMVSGKIKAGVLVPPGNVTITLNGLVQNVTIKSDGSFSASFTTGALAPGSYNIAYSYSATANFLAASGVGKLMVSYKITPRFDQNKAKNAGSTLPVKLELTDAFATNVSSPSVPVTVMGIALASKPTVLLPAQDSGQANPNGLFRQQEKGYIFNLSTKGLAPGKYILFVKAGNDPIIQQITFLLS